MKDIALLIAILSFVGHIPANCQVLTEKRPNILWIVMDDVGIEFPYFGHDVIETPNIDRLVNEGTLFTHAIVTAPVCSPSRSAMITGMYQTTIGANNHVSGRGEHRISLPAQVKLVPELFREAGYYVTNGDYPFNGDALGKADYNFDWDTMVYSSNDWKHRAPGQPFFAQVQLLGGKNRDKKGWLDVSRKELGNLTDTGRIQLPPYYPRDPVILKDWGEYLDCIRYTDKQIGEILERLSDEGELDNTVIILMGDNGISHARGKQFLYDEGIRTLFVVKGPGIGAGQVRNDMIEHIDMAAISLAAADLEVPDWMQGKNVFDRRYRKRQFVYAARDRCGEAVDRIRAVRSERFKYIRNADGERPHLQPSNYKDAKAIIRQLRSLHAEGRLNTLQEKLLFAPQRPEEELYDLKKDPFELVNLAYDRKYQRTLAKFRQALENWSTKTGDPDPETFAIYELEMKNQIERTRPGEARDQVIKNVEWYKQQLKTN